MRYSTSGSSGGRKADVCDTSVKSHSEAASDLENVSESLEIQQPIFRALHCKKKKAPGQAPTIVQPRRCSLLCHTRRTTTVDSSFSIYGMIYAPVPNGMYSTRRSVPSPTGRPSRPDDVCSSILSTIF